MLYGVVFAGGRSSRMGEDKAAMSWQGATLLDRARQILREAGVDQVLVSGRPELTDGIPDLFEYCGPPAGLYSTLQYLKTLTGQLAGDRLLVIPVDMPLLSSVTLRRLLDSSDNAECLHFNGEIFPCLVRASDVLYQHLQLLFQNQQTPGGQRSMKAVFRFLQAQALTVDDIDEREFSNVNTPQDWQSLA